MVLTRTLNALVNRKMDQSKSFHFDDFTVAAQFADHDLLYSLDSQGQSACSKEGKSCECDAESCSCTNCGSHGGKKEATA